MLEVIDDVLRAEEAADALLQKARDDANRMQQELATQETNAVKAAREDSDRRLREEISSIREEQASRLAQAEARIRESARALSAGQDARIANTVQRLVRLVVDGE